MWEGTSDEGTNVVLELNALEECHKMEQETVWFSSGGGTSLEKSRKRERKLMSLHASIVT